MLHQLYEWVQDFLETDPTDEERDRMREHALSYLNRLLHVRYQFARQGEVHYLRAGWDDGGLNHSQICDTIWLYRG